MSLQLCNLAYNCHIITINDDYHHIHYVNRVAEWVYKIEYASYSLMMDVLLEYS